MGLLDNLDDKAKDVMDDPQRRAQVEQIAKDKGISMEQAAREYLSREHDHE